MFSCKTCEIFKSTYFEEHLRTTASVQNFIKIRICAKSWLKTSMILTLTHSFPMHPFSAFLMFSGYRERVYLIGKKSVGKKFCRQKILSVKNIRHQGKNSSLFTDGFFTGKVLGTNELILISFLIHTQLRLSILISF